MVEKIMVADILVRSRSILDGSRVVMLELEASVVEPESAVVEPVETTDCFASVAAWRPELSVLSFFLHAEKVREKMSINSVKNRHTLFVIFLYPIDILLLVIVIFGLDPKIFKEL